MRALYPGAAQRRVQVCPRGPEQIEQAKADWKAGRVDTVPGDAEEFIPLPDTNKVSRYPVAPAEIIRDGTAHLPSAR